MQNLDEQAQQLMMSPTLEGLFKLAQKLPTDTNNPEELRAALAVAGNALINALDNDRIHFDNDLDKGMLYGLLVVTTDFVMEGKLKTAFKPATMQ